MKEDRWRLFKEHLKGFRLFYLPATEGGVGASWVGDNGNFVSLYAETVERLYTKVKTRSQQEIYIKLNHHSLMAFHAKLERIDASEKELKECQKAFIEVLQNMPQKTPSKKDKPKPQPHDIYKRNLG